MITTGGLAATEVGQSHIVVQDGIATNHSQAAWDCHPGAWRITFQNLATHNSYPGCSAIQVRGPDCNVIDCTAEQVDTGVQLIYGADRANVKGGRIVGTTTAINVESSDDIEIGGGLEVENPLTNFLLTSVDAGWSMPTGIALGSLVVKGAPSNLINNGAACPIVYTA